MGHIDLENIKNNYDSKSTVTLKLDRAAYETEVESFKIHSYMTSFVSLCVAASVVILKFSIPHALVILMCFVVVIGIGWVLQINSHNKSLIKVKIITIILEDRETENKLLMQDINSQITNADVKKRFLSGT